MTIDGLPTRSRREEVLAAAADVFSEKGYRSSTIQDIGRALGFTSGALYYYFDSKQDMLSEIIVRPMNQLIEAATTISATNDSNADKLKALIASHVTMTIEQRELFTILLRERVELSPTGAAKLAALEDDYYAHIRAIIEAGITAGEFNVDNPNIAALGLIGTVSWVVRWYRNDGHLNATQIAEEQYKILFNGLAPRPTKTKRPTKQQKN